MRRGCARGEQSGHIIFSGRSTTGDGLLTALLLLDIVHRSGKTLAELVADLKVFPQVIVNVKVREKRPLDGIPAVAAAIARLKWNWRYWQGGDSVFGHGGAGAGDD